MTRSIRFGGREFQTGGRLTQIPGIILQVQRCGEQLRQTPGFRSLLHRLVPSANAIDPSPHILPDFPRSQPPVILAPCHLLWFIIIIIIHFIFLLLSFSSPSCGHFSLFAIIPCWKWPYCEPSGTRSEGKRQWKTQALLLDWKGPGKIKAEGI